MLVLFSLLLCFQCSTANSDRWCELRLFCPQKGFYKNPEVMKLIDGYIFDLKTSETDDNTKEPCGLAAKTFDGLISLIHDNRLVYKNELINQFKINTYIFMDVLGFAAKCAGFYSILHVLLIIGEIFYKHAVDVAVELIQNEPKNEVPNFFTTCKHVFRICSFSGKIEVWRSHKTKMELVFRDIFRVTPRNEKNNERNCVLN